MSVLNILVGAGDIPGVRRALSESLAEPCPAFTMRLTSLSRVSAIRSDPEINRKLVELLGYRRPDGLKVPSFLSEPPLE